MRAREHDRVLDAPLDGLRQRTHLAPRALQLHEDRGEPLRQIVVDIARKPVSFFERGFAALFGALALCEARDVQHERRLSRNRRSEEHTSELQSLTNLVCRLLLE